MNFDDITTDIAPLDPVHDRRHALERDPLARESIVYTVILPEERIAGWVYPRVSAEGKAAGIVCAFGDGIKGGAIYENIHETAVPDTMDFTDWKVSGIQMRLGTPLRTARVGYESDRLSYDIEFDALHPAYSYDSHPDGCPKYFADNRFEQSGRVRGTMRVDGRAIVIDGLGQRDHSWGSRNWGVNYHYKWFHATTPVSAVHFFKMEYLGRSLIRGYVYKNGHMSQIRDLQVVDFTLDEDMIHTDIEVLVYDIAGRITRISGRHVAHQPLPILNAGVVLNEVALTVEVDGRPGIGWCEMQWDTRYLDHMRQYKHIRR